MKSKTACGADALSSRANDRDCRPIRNPRNRAVRRGGALFMMAIVGIVLLGSNAGCMERIDNCVTYLRFEFASSGEPVANACVEFATQGSLGGLSPGEFLDRNATFRTMTSVGGGASVRMPISTSLLSDATHGIVDPIWIARIHLPDRTETIVFQRNYQYTTSDDIMLQQVGEFIGSMGDTIVVTEVSMIGCGSGIMPNEGCTHEP